MPSKKMLLFGLGVVVATVFVINQAKKNPSGIAAKIASVGA